MSTKEQTKRVERHEVPTFRVPTLPALSKHRGILADFHLIAKETLRTGEIDPLSFEIIHAVSQLAFIPCFLLRFFSLRFSEVHQLTIPLIISADEIVIHQQKTGETKIARTGTLRSALLRYETPRDVRLCCIPYDRLRREIALIRDRMHLDVLDGCENSTHIFRHISASWKFYHTGNRLLVSGILGHMNPDSASSYIHDYSALLSRVAK